MDTPQITLKIFTCITVHQTSIFYKHWRWYSPSTSKIVGWHMFHLLPNLYQQKNWKAYKSLTTSSHYLSSFVLPLDTNTKSSTATGNYQSFSRALRVHLAKDETIPSYKAPKSYAILIKCINIDNLFNLLFLLYFY